MEKVQLFELDINVSKAVEETRALKAQLQLLQEQAKKVKDESGELSNEYLEYQAALKLTGSEIRTNEKLTENLIAANNANSGSIEQMRKQLSVVSVQWAKLSKDERENTEFGKKLTQQKTELTKALKAEEAATNDNRRNVGNYTASIQEALGVTSNFIPVVGQAASGAATMGKAFTAALGPVGLIVAAIGLLIGALKAFFSSTEDGQNKFARLWAVVSVVIDNIVDAFAALGEALLEPEKILQGFLDFMENTFGNVIFGVIDLIGAQFSAFFSSINLGYQQFVGLFTDNQDKINQAKKELQNDVKNIDAAGKRIEKGADNIALAWDKATDAIGNFIDENIREAKIAQELADKQANLDKYKRAALVENAKIARDLAKLKNQIEQKDTFTAEERLKFLEEANKKEQEILKNNLAIAQSTYNIALQRSKLAGQSKEDLDELAKLQADLYKVQEDNFNKTKELETKKIEISAAAAKEKIDNELKAVQALIKSQNEADKLLEAQAIADAEFQEVLKANAEEAQARKLMDYNNEYELAKNNIFQRLELEKQALIESEAQEIEAAEKIGASTTLIEAKYAEARKEINKAETDAKLALASQFLGNIATIAGEGTAIGKAAAVAQTTISTYQAAQAAYAGMLIAVPGPIGIGLGIAAAAAAVATGLANVKKILAVDSGLPGGKSTKVGGGVPSSGGSGGSSFVRSSSVAPQVNQGIISRSQINNNQNNQISQQILVVDDVTNAQKKESSNIKTSTI